MANNAYDGLFIQGPSAQSAINTDVISGVVNGAIDASMYGWCSVQITATAGISAGAITFEGSNDGTNYVVLSTQEIPPSGNFGGVSVSAITIAASTSRIFAFSVNTKFVRARISTAFVGGTISAFASFKQTSPSPNTVAVRNGTAASMTTTATPASGTTHLLGSAAASTNATSVKASAGALFTLSLTNMSAAVKYFKLYNKASAPTVGTDVPVLTVPVAANSAVVFEFGAVGQQMSTGIAYALTGAMADADTTALAAGDMKVALTYI